MAVKPSLQGVGIARNVHQQVLASNFLSQWGMQHSVNKISEAKECNDIETLVTTLTKCKNTIRVLRNQCQHNLQRELHVRIPQRVLRSRVMVD